jgi:hypothetical protein
LNTVYVETTRTTARPIRTITPITYLFTVGMEW